RAARQSLKRALAASRSAIPAGGSCLYSTMTYGMCLLLLVGSIERLFQTHDGRNAHRKLPVDEIGELLYAPCCFPGLALGPQQLGEGEACFDHLGAIVDALRCHERPLREASRTGRLTVPLHQASGPIGTVRKRRASVDLAQRAERALELLP